MNYLAALASICLVLSGTDSFAECPAGYPKGFPCIPGGVSISVPAPAEQPVAPNEFYVLRYDKAAKTLYDMLLSEAFDAAWVAESRSEAEEPGGRRFRALLRNPAQAVSISVVSRPEGSYLLVVKGLPK
jgi:hypothetical protein